MYRLLTPILAFIVALTLFFTFVQPTFNEYKDIDAELADYELALDSAERLQNRVNQLDAEKTAIPQSDLERLMTFLPNEVDEVGIVLTLDELSSRHNLALEQISVKSSRTRGGTSNESTDTFAFDDDPEDLTREQTRPDGTVVPQPTDHIETTALSFSVTGKYEDFRAFVTELESSLSLMDITRLSIKEVEDQELATYALGVSMYSFKATE